MAIELPKYVLARRRKDGSKRFYFHVTGHMRPDGWPVAMRLSDDVGEMFRQAEVLNSRLKTERSGMQVPGHAKGTVPWLLQLYHQTPRYKALSPNTQSLYGYCANEFLSWSKKAGHPAIKMITRPAVLKYLAQFDDMPTKKKKNYIFLRLLLSYACDLGVIEINPALNLRIKDPEVQVHIWTDAEIDAAIAAADDLGVRSIGTAILVAADTAQRQGDVLDLQYGRDYRDGRFLFRQNKTKELMGFPATEKLKTRLDGDVGLIVPGPEGKKYTRRDFINRFTRVREKAGLKHCKFQTLRHTAIVRLARAGCTHSQIAAISGHTEASAASILQRYLPRDSEVAEAAISKLEAKRSTDQLTP